MIEKISKHFLVTGKVQGVWFRANTKKEADRLGLSGWVRNLPDGRVEAMICGAPQQVGQMEAWLQHGPELARVDQLQVEALPWRDYADFRIIE